jgi:glycosyltransferase involved in cell wall biosynthesis
MANSRGMLTSISGSAGEFIVENNIGLKYSNSDTNSLFNIISNLTSNDDLIEIMSTNARKLYEDKFLYTKVYGSLVASLELLADNEN